MVVRLNLRVVLVIAALFSLCVSSNVGPRFAPLPVLTNRAAEDRQDNLHNNASRSSLPGDSDSFRVPMMAQSHKRAVKGPQPQPLATILTGSLVLPILACAPAEFSYSALPLKSSLVSQPPGRAPPRLL